MFLLHRSCSSLLLTIFPNISIDNINFPFVTIPLLNWGGPRIQNLPTSVSLVLGLQLWAPMQNNKYIFLSNVVFLKIMLSRRNKTFFLKWGFSSSQGHHEILLVVLKHNQYLEGYFRLLPEQVNILKYY